MKKSLIAITAAIVMAAGTPGKALAANPLETLGDIVGQITSTDKFQLTDIAGNWSYKSPAVSFKSDKAINKLGGAAAATTLERKLESYYRTAGISGMSLNITHAGDSVADFALKVGKLPLKGTLAKDGETGNLIFKFAGTGRLSPGELPAKAEKNATGELSITFDASKFIEILSKVAAFTNNASAKALSSMLSSYDGIYIGAKMGKTSGADNTPNSGSSQLGNIVGAAKDALK